MCIRDRLGALGCEATTLGNHEFDYRSKGLAKMLETAAESGDTAVSYTHLDVYKRQEYDSVGMILIVLFGTVLIIEAISHYIRKKLT